VGDRQQEHGPGGRPLGVQEQSPDQRQHPQWHARWQTMKVSVSLQDIALTIVAVFVILAYFNGWG
jgi:hypothetical protein